MGTAGLDLSLAGLEEAVAEGADSCLLVAVATRFAHGEASVLAESPKVERSAGVFVVAGRVGAALVDSVAVLVAQGEGSFLAAGA